MMAPTDIKQEIVKQAAQATPEWPEWFRPPSHWPSQSDLLNWCQHMTPGLAALLILLGVVYLIFGYKIFKGLVMLNAAAVGAAIGLALGQRTEMGLALMVLCGFVAAAVTWPLMKWAVAVMGGLAGALLGATIWQTFGLDPTFAWSGALSGLILFGLISFILFRGSVTMYMSLQGAAMLIFGLLGMIDKYEQVAPKITNAMMMKPFLLPMAIIIPAIVGMLYQQSDGGAAAPGKK
jgi:hypothetical protein